MLITSIDTPSNMFKALARDFYRNKQALNLLWIIKQIVVMIITSTDTHAYKLKALSRDFQAHDPYPVSLS